MVFEREIKAVFCPEMPVFDSRDKCSSLFENEMLRKILVKRSQISRGFQSFQNFFKRTCFCSENLQSWFWLNALWRILLRFCVGCTHPENAKKNHYNALFVSYHHTEIRFLCLKVDEPKSFLPSLQGKYKQIELNVGFRREIRQYLSKIKTMTYRHHSLRHYSRSQYSQSHSQNEHIAPAPA